MTDAQQLFDFARTQFNEIAADVERHFELVAHQLREWIPTDSTFITRPPPPKKAPPPTAWQVVQRWMAKHTVLTAATIAFLATGSIGALVYRTSVKGGQRKRRARRSPSGARTDVVVVAGSFANPLVSILALDLERRGFVTYVTASTEEEELYIRSQNRADLRPLQVDLVDPFRAQDQLVRFQSMFGRNHSAFDSAEPHQLGFCGLVLMPDMAIPEARMGDLSMEEWSDALNVKVINTIATVQHFLPAVVKHGAKVLLLTPSVTPSLMLPGHVVETTIYGALKGFISTLATEMQQEGVSVSHLRLGSIDIPSVTAKQRREGKKPSRLKASPPRRLQNAVFDALTARHPSRTWHVGRGSLAYDIIGAIAPPAAVAWMMGKQRERTAKDLAQQIEMRDEDMHESQASIAWEKISEVSEREV